MGKNKVSIIIPTYNRAHLIGETLDSVIAQTYQNWECIVVDDGSTDDTAKVMEAYMAKDSRIQYHHRPPEHKPGGNGARNYGFKMSRGEYIQWFDDDDIMMNNKLEFKLNNYKPNLDFIITTGIECNEDLEVIKKISISFFGDLYTEYAVYNIKILTPSIFFSRAFLDENELFREDIYKGQETEFFCRIFSRSDNTNFILLDEPLFLYRKHLISKSGVKNYNRNFKFSQSQIFTSNFAYAYSRKNERVFKYCYKKLINILFQALRNGDKRTFEFIVKNNLKIIKRKNFILFVEMNMFLPFLSFTKKGTFFFQKRWRNYKFYA